MKEKLSIRQKLAIRMALFIIDILNPLEYTHKLKEFKDEFINAMSDDKPQADEPNE